MVVGKRIAGLGQSSDFMKLLLLIWVLKSLKFRQGGGVKFLTLVKKKPPKTFKFHKVLLELGCNKQLRS